MKQGWEIKKLGEVCNINYGTRVVQKKDGGTIYPVYGGGGATFKMDRYNREDCLIVSRFAMSSQCVRYVSGKFFLNDSGLTIESYEAELSQSFLDKHIIALNDVIYSLGKGVAQKNLDIKELKLLDIKYPKSREEQERIVEELDCLSGVIEKKREQLKQLDALAQSIFYQMFGDPITNEKGWEVKKLGEVANSVNYGTSSPATEGGYYTYIRMNNLTYSGYLDLNDVKKIDVSENEIEKCIVRKGDILFNRTNSKDLVGKTALFDLDEEMIIAGYIIRVRVNTDVVLPIYVVRYMNTPFMKTYFRNLCKGAVNQANINSKELKAIPILMPHIELQQEYAEKIEAIEKQKELIKQSITQTEELFNSRMDYYFN